VAEGLVKGNKATVNSIVNHLRRIVNNKYIQVVVLTVATVYFIIASILNIPYTAVVVGCMIVVVLLLDLYRLSTTHEVGHIVLTKDAEGKKTFTLELNDDPEQLEFLKKVSFRIKVAESQETQPL